MHIVGHSIKSHIKVEVNDTRCPSLIHRSIHFIIEGSDIGQHDLSLVKSKSSPLWTLFLSTKVWENLSLKTEGKTVNMTKPLSAFAVTKSSVPFSSRSTFVVCLFFSYWGSGRSSCLCQFSRYHPCMPGQRYSFLFYSLTSLSPSSYFFLFVFFRFLFPFLPWSTATSPFFSQAVSWYVHSVSWVSGWTILVLWQRMRLKLPGFWGLLSFKATLHWIPFTS